MKNTKQSQVNKEARREKRFHLLTYLSVIAALGVFIVGEAFVSRYTGGSFVAVVTRLTALAFLSYAVFCALYRRFPRFSKVCRTIWHVIAQLMVLLFIIIEILIALGDKNDYPIYESAPVNYMIVLGAGIKGRHPSLSLASRLDEAARQLFSRPEMLVVVSGGQGPGEDITEAQAMYDYLVLKGVEPERIFKEERSVNTAQNIAYSVEILKTLEGFKPESGTIVCSNGYHLFRARLLLKRNGVTPYALAADLPRFYLKLTGYIREFFSVMLMWRSA